MEMLELLETIRSDQASVQRLYGGEGAAVRHGRKSADYLRKLAEAVKLVADVSNGRRPTYILQEVMTTSDFPYLFGDILDRQLLANYQEWPVSWPNYCKRGKVRDFRQVKRFGMYGVDQVLDQVDENEPYPNAAMNEDTPYAYNVYKHGRTVPYSWETLINDDLGAFEDTPERLGRAARRSEEKFVASLFVDANGPHASFYTGGNANIVTSNPALSDGANGIKALQTAMTILGAKVDQQGEPIVIDTVELVVPPALEIPARNILNALQLIITQIPSRGAGKESMELVTLNWMKDKMRLSVNPYIPIVASSANGSTSWFLFANPSNGRPALELGFLLGHETPETFMKAPNAQRIGGGSDAMAGDFETDSIQYKVRHVYGGSRMDPKMTVASNGSGS